MPEILTAGHICLDIIPELPSNVSFTPGRLVEVGQATLCTGGSVANTGGTLARLGMDVGLLGKIGSDPFGRTVRELLDGLRPGLGEAMIVSPEPGTSYTIVLAAPGRDRMFLHDPGCNATFGEADVPAAALAGARILHFGYPPLMPRMYRNDGEEMVALLRRAKGQGLFTSLDMTVPDPSGESGRVNWRRWLSRVLPYVDLFMPNVEELSFMIDGRSVEHIPPAGDPIYPRLTQAVADMGVRLAGLKAGDQGFFLRVADVGSHPLAAAAVPGDYWSPPFEVDVKGTTGAGDATIAGMLMGLSRGKAFEEVLIMASAIGACCCERSDAVSGIRPWPVVEARIAAGWDRRPLAMPSPWSRTTGQIFRAG